MPININKFRFEGIMVTYAIAPVAGIQVVLQMVIDE